MAKRPHPFPFRTRKLSSSAPMVVGAHAPVRVGRCRASETSSVLSWFFCAFHLERDGLFLKDVKDTPLTDSRCLRLGRSKEVKEASEGSTECTMYMSTERGKPTPRSAAYHRSGFRTRKLSSRADGSWGRASPVRVGCCWQVETSSVTDWFFCYMFINERKFKTLISYYVS